MPARFPAAAVFSVFPAVIPFLSASAEKNLRPAGERLYASEGRRTQ
jgi:hypothetical protein